MSGAARMQAWRRAYPERAREANRKHRQTYYERHRDAVKARTAARQREQAEREKAQRAKECVCLETIDELGAAMTYEEIARELGISKARVGQIVASALRKLRQQKPRLAELLTG